MSRVGWVVSKEIINCYHLCINILLIKFNFSFSLTLINIPWFLINQSLMLCFQLSLEGMPTPVVDSLSGAAGDGGGLSSSVQSVASGYQLYQGDNSTEQDVSISFIPRFKVCDIYRFLTER